MQALKKCCRHGQNKTKNTETKERARGRDKTPLASRFLVTIKSKVGCWDPTMQGSGHYSSKKPRNKGSQIQKHQPGQAVGNWIPKHWLAGNNNLQHFDTDSAFSP